MVMRQIVISVVALVVAIDVHGSAANALSMKECSAKYNAAKEAGTLGGMKWNDFRKAQCGAEATSAPTPSKRPRLRVHNRRKRQLSGLLPRPRCNRQRGISQAVSPKYWGEFAGKARMQTCLDQYRANKATGATEV